MSAKNDHVGDNEDDDRSITAASLVQENIIADNASHAYAVDEHGDDNGELNNYGLDDDNTYNDKATYDTDDDLYDDDVSSLYVHKLCLYDNNNDYLTSTLMAKTLSSSFDGGAVIPFVSVSVPTLKVPMSNKFCCHTNATVHTTARRFPLCLIFKLTPRITCVPNTFLILTT